MIYTVIVRKVFLSSHEVVIMKKKDIQNNVI